MFAHLGIAQLVNSHTLCVKRGKESGQHDLATVVLKEDLHELVEKLLDQGFARNASAK